MPKAQKDRPLRLRRRQDGKLYLLGEWPPRHEFSQDWLMQNTLAGTVKMSADSIELNLANASAIYSVTQRPGEEVDGARTTGYWGKLAEGKVK